MSDISYLFIYHKHEIVNIQTLYIHIYIQSKRSSTKRNGKSQCWIQTNICMCVCMCILFIWKPNFLFTLGFLYM